MEKASPNPSKPRFAEICQQYNLDVHAMQAIADKAGVSKQVVDQISVSIAVHRAQALKVLAALSEQTGETWTLDNVRHVTR